ncbi:hypothetical protein [Bacillus badius]|uniref:hypothetical protein n=1 Tax=Bacillus badius TaxID=1455 RepID=UPI0009E301DB|nr:hypothetical protein [Bacillus badius]MED4715464.1 hypothetical protein [Bacillus badius]
MHKTREEVETNMDYNWFLSYGFHDKVPHFSTWSVYTYLDRKSRSRTLDLKQIRSFKHDKARTPYIYSRVQKAN